VYTYIHKKSVNSASKGTEIYKNYCAVIVGSGLYGLTMAERITHKFKRQVLVIERRNHIGGNVWSEIDPSTGIEVHKYGSHIFHTSNEKVWAYINRFTKFNSYQHHVWALHKKRLYPLPIGLATLSSFYGTSVTPIEVDKYIPHKSKTAIKFGDLESKAISLIGKELYEAFIKNYTAKQWQIDARNLPEEIITRLPVRRNLNTRYFDDTYEGIPSEGYSKMLLKMVDNPLIDLQLDTDFFEVRDQIPPQMPLIYTGEIDKFFDYKFGQLNWRTLDFEIERIAVNDYQGTSVINYSDLDVDYTRIHEFKHFHPEWRYTSEETIISREFSRMALPGDEPYYPVNTAEDRQKMSKYREAGEAESNVHFGGRLGSYQYLDMHMAIASALSDFENSVAGMVERD
jgi:UDP-galactopyranose mutase